MPHQSSILLVFMTGLLSMSLHRTMPPCGSTNYWMQGVQVEPDSLGVLSSSPLPSYDTDNTTTSSSTKIRLLPDRLITVVGLESSGTTFVWKTLATALGATQDRSADIDLVSPDGSIRVQHLSLPSGRFPTSDPAFRACQFEPLPTVPLYIPNGCARSSLSAKARPRPAPVECAPFGPNLVGRPIRFFVNITSHIQWYRDQGVDAQAVIVVRDPALRFLGILKKQVVGNETAAYEQYLKGKALLQEATRNAKLRPVLVSYETLMTLQTTYLFEIYKQLNISVTAKTSIPIFHNGNVKYHSSTPRDVQKKLLADDGKANHVIIPSPS